MTKVKTTKRGNHTFRITDKLHNALRIKAAKEKLDMSDIVEAGILMSLDLTTVELRNKLEAI